MTDYDAVKGLLGKHRFGPMDNSMLTKAILHALKSSQETETMECGHNSSYSIERGCSVCLSVLALGDSNESTASDPGIMS